MTDLVVADCAIRQLHARYIDAVWRKDIDAFVDCFAEDAEWKIGGINTLVLLTSSLTMVLAVHFAKLGQMRLVVWLLTDLYT